MTLTKNLQTNFTLRSLSENEREQAVHFIEYREIECTALMEALLSGAEDIYVLENSRDKKFCALFYLRNTSTLFHFIPFLSEDKNPDYNFTDGEKIEVKKLISDFLQTQKIFCVYGEAYGGEYIKEILLNNGKEMITSIDYILMKNDFSSEMFKSEISIRNNWKKLNVRKCSVDDMELLVDLERGYSEEEVQIMEHKVTDQIIKFVLNKSLNSQTVMAAFKIEGARLCAIAKAATNAKGKNYYQIGGVYCQKENRNQGYTNFVMQHLLRYIQAEGKTANLFVKEKNEPAKKLYVNLGFIPTGKYQISYFQK